jgi:hypothetical protein
MQSNNLDTGNNIGVIMMSVRKLVFITAAVLVLFSCAGTIDLATEYVSREEDVPGLFTVLFSGRHYFEEVDAVVILDLEGDEYRFVTSTRDMDYEILKSLSYPEAFYESGPFFRLHEAFSGKTRLYRIMSPDGRTVGYELRPIYFPAYLGVADLVKTRYRVTEDGRIYYKSWPKSKAEILFEK